MTILSKLSRQLSVLVFALSATTVLAQGSAGTRNAINNQAAMTYPGMPNAMPTMYVHKLTVGPTQNEKLKLQSFYFNEDLTLGVQYNYQFDIDFKVDTARGQTPVPDGWYLLTIATFLKDGRMYDNPKKIDPNETLEMRYVTSNRPRLVRVIGGATHPDVSLRFDNPSRASVENTLYVEFRPVVCPKQNPNCIVLGQDGEPDIRNSPWVPARGFADKQYLMSAPWVPATGAMSGGTDPSKRAVGDSAVLRELGLDSFANKVQIERSKNPDPNAPSSFSPVPPARYAATHNLKLYDVDDADFYDLGQVFAKRDVRPILHEILDNRSAGPIVLSADKERLIAVLCGVISKNSFPNQTKEQQFIRQRLMGVRISMCNRGELDLQIRRIVNVGQITDQFARPNYLQIFKYVLMNNLSVGRSHDESASSTVTWKVWNTFFSWMGPAASSMTSPLFIAKDILGAVPIDWTHSVTVSNSRNKNQSGINSIQKYLDIVPVMVTANAANVQTCVEVATDPSSRSALLNQRDPRAPRGLLICGRMQAQAKVQEFFMHAYTRMSDSALAGPYDRLEQTLNLTIRGDRDISTFFRLIQSSLKPTTDDGDVSGAGFPDWYTESANAYFARPPMKEPGVITSPVVFGRDQSVPSLLSKLWGSYHEDFVF